MKKTFSISLVGLILALSLAGSALAATQAGFSCSGPGGTNCTYVPLEPLSNINQSGNTTMAAFINSLFKILFSLSALFAVAMLTMGGIEYMISDVAERKNEGIRRATAALYGILILGGSYLLLYTINPQLLNFNLNLSSATNTTNTTTSTTATSESGGNNSATQSTNLDSCKSMYRSGQLGGMVHTGSASDVAQLATCTSQCEARNGAVQTIESGTDKGGAYTVVKCVGASSATH